MNTEHYDIMVDYPHAGKTHSFRACTLVGKQFCTARLKDYEFNGILKWIVPAPLIEGIVQDAQLAGLRVCNVKGMKIVSSPETI